jgi:hypothetical protein
VSMMHSHSRKSLLSSALAIPPGSMAITRDTVEAALWQTVGWDADDGLVSRLLAVIDAYADDRSRRAIATWLQAGRGDELPPPASLTQLQAVRRQLQVIGMSDSAADAARSQLWRSRVTRSPEFTTTRRTPLVAVRPAAVASQIYAAAPVSDDDAGESSEVMQPLLAPPDDDALVECTSCRERGREPLHPLCDFYKDKSRKSGIAARCKRCKKEDSAKWRGAAAKRVTAAGVPECVSDVPVPVPDDEQAVRG